MSTTKLGLTPALEKILIEAFYPFHFLTAEQVARLLYSPGSVNGVKAHLKKLAEGGYLDRFYLPTGFNLRPYVYMLGRKGKAYFQEEKGWDVPKLPTVSVMEQRSHSFLMHLLVTNSVIIAAKLIGQYAPTGVFRNEQTGEEEELPLAWLERFEHDVTLKSSPLVSTAQGRKIAVVPDAVLEVRAWLKDGKKSRRVLWVEVERGTNNDRDILTKLQAIYDVLDNEVFQQRYQTRNVKICYVSTAGTADVERLRGLARVMLEEKRGEEAYRLNTLFNFIAVPDLGTDIDTREVFLQPAWVHPYETTGKSLVIK